MLNKSNKKSAKQNLSLNDISEQMSMSMPKLIRYMHPFIFKDIVVPPAQMYALISIEEEVSCNLTVLRKKLFVSAPTASGLVNRLVKSGYVKRVQDKEDRRGITLTLTPAGVLIIKRFRKNIKNKWYSVLETFSPDQRMKPLLFVNEVLKKLKDNAMNSKVLQVCLCLSITLSLILSPVFAQEKIIHSLSLEQVTEQALNNNFDIQLAKYDAWIAQTGQVVAESIYDSVISFDMKYRDNRNKQILSALGTKTRDDDYAIGFSKKLPTGTKLNLDMTNNEFWSNSTVQNEDKVNNSAMGLYIEQDLGRNFLGIQDRGSVKLKRLDIEQEQYISLDKIEVSLAQVQKAYWDLVLHMELVIVEQDMVEQAKQLYDLHQEKLIDGLVEKPEALASEANYRKRKNQLVLAESLVEAKQNMLNLLLNISDDRIIIKPTDRMIVNVDEKQVADSMNMAFKNRRDYMRKKMELESRDIMVLMEKNNLWPIISLKASFDHNGISDYLGDAVGDIFDEDDPDLSVSLSVSFPLLNRESKSLLKAAELEKLKEIVSMKLLERSIMIEVFDSVRNCNVLGVVANNDIEISKLHEEKLKEELKLYNYGRSDTDTIIRFQEDLIQAEFLSLKSQFAYQSALIDLALIEGYLLNRYANAANILKN